MLITLRSESAAPDESLVFIGTLCSNCQSGNGERDPLTRWSLRVFSVERTTLGCSWMRCCKTGCSGRGVTVSASACHRARPRTCYACSSPRGSPQAQSADVCSMDPTPDTRGPQATPHSHLDVIVLGRAHIQHCQRFPDDRLPSPPPLLHPLR